MEHKKHSAKKQRSGQDLQSVRTSIGSLAYELWLEKRNTLNPAEVEWLVDGRLMQQLGALSKTELSRVERLLKRTVTHAGRRYMTGSPI
jgi:hypothetical protein